jgi:hypothetical protein
MSLALLLALLVPQADDPFAWFDALGYPDLKELAYVRVFTGQSFKRPGQAPEPVTEEAFLLHDAGKSFTVLSLHLGRTEFKKSESGIKEERVAYEKIDLTKSARTRLDALKAPPKDEERGFGRRGPSPTELFVLARGCDRQGHKEVARELLEAAARLPDPRTGKRPDTTLAQTVAAEIALGRVWQAVRDFGNPEIPRRQLLETFVEIANKFPETEHAALALETVKLLGTMVKEDAAHAEPKQPPSKLPLQERVAELIFHLRDQNGGQYSQPGECDFFVDPKGEASPAHQLAAIGADAVPKLIEALGDARFTRSVGFHRDFYFSHHVLRVGDAALAVLEKIAGKRFFQRAYTNGAMTKDEAAKATKVAALAWWAEFQKKGEKQSLVEAAEKGDLLQARRLLEKYPDVALAAMSKALGEAKDGHARGALVELVIKIPGEESTALLSAELKQGPHTGTRIAAARELIRRGRPEVLGLLTEEWKKAATAKRNQEEEFFERPTEAIIAALVATGRPEAIRVLAADFPKRPLGERMAILCGVSNGEGFFSLNRHGEPEARPPGVTVENEREAAELAEDLLASALDDTTVQEGRSAGRPGLSFSDPRVCDAAAHILAFRWPKRYTFDIGANRKLRDRQVAEARNAWRRARGREPLPLPAEKGLPPLAASVVDLLVEGLLKGDAGSEEALLSKGLPALKAAQERLGKLGKDDVRRPALEGVVRSLGCVVAETKVSPVPPKKDDAFAALVAGLEGKPMTPGSLRAFLEKAVTLFPEGAVGFRMTIDRESDLGGIRVVVETVTEKVQKGRSVGVWSMSEIVMLGQEGLLHYGGNARANYATTAEGWKMLKQPVETVFAAPATSSFSIRVSRIQME